jgi:cysteine-rich CPCC protein
MRIVRHNLSTGEEYEYDDGRPEPIPSVFCPCCGYKTLYERAGLDICKICFWEDDGQDDVDADVVRGGSNEELSLTQARRNYAKFGACDESFVKDVKPPSEGDRLNRRSIEC